MDDPDDAAIARLAAGVIDGTLPRQEWTHAAHFAAALWLCRCDLTEPDAIRALICRYNAATHTPNTDTGGYHHTITLASMRGAADMLARHPAITALREVHAALMASPLGTRDWLLGFWSRDRLFSVAARRSWVAPDLAPLPF